MKKLLKLVFFRYFDRDVKMYFITLSDADHMHQATVQLLLTLAEGKHFRGFLELCVLMLSLFCVQCTGKDIQRAR